MSRNKWFISKSVAITEKLHRSNDSTRLFTIVDHLDQLNGVTAQPERTEIARLNLMAGQKAKTATAYEAALKYFNTGSTSIQRVGRVSMTHLSAVFRSSRSIFMVALMRWNNW